MTITFLVMMLMKCVNVLPAILATLMAVAFYVVSERKIMASVQRRRGPAAVGLWGILQPIADGVKLVLKEMVIPNAASRVSFASAPTLLMALSFACWAFIPVGYNNFIFDSEVSLFYVLGFSALGVYGLVAAGWTSHSRYALLGGLRAVAQLVSYEVALGLIVLPVGLLSGSLNLIDIVYMQSQLGWFCFSLAPLFLLFVISMLAETNRTPFDLPEAEAELVSGFNVEYASTTFAMFFLAEYSNMLLMSALGSILFLGGWAEGYFLFVVKILFLAFLFVLIRAAVPRYRYDQLMMLGWRNFLFFVFGFFIFILGLLVYVDGPVYSSEAVWSEGARALSTWRLVYVGDCGSAVNFVK